MFLVSGNSSLNKPYYRMHKNYMNVFLNVLLVLVCLCFQRCTNPEAIAPQPADGTTDSDVLKKIKSLGFTENQIKETSDYYLAGGDLYFSKKISGNITTSTKKSGHRILEKYATLTIHVDESLAATMDEPWRRGIDQAITEWNAYEKAHFHFEFTNSTAANITLVKDTSLPQDLAIASEFPRDGRTGSSIRINVDAKAVENPTQAFTHALEHCVGFLHSTSVKSDDAALKNPARKNARGPRFNLELYAIQGDVLYRVDATTGEYFPVNAGWAGTEVMGQINGMLYMVQFGTLWVVNPSTGDWSPLTSGWEGSQYITTIPASAQQSPAGKLYIMQDSWIWPVDPDTGLWDANLGSFTLPRGLIGFTDAYDNNKYKLAALRRKPGSTTVSILYVIDPLSGTVLSSKTVPASGIASWNKTFLLTSTPVRIEVFNGTVNFEDALGGHFTQGFWPDVELVTSYGNSIYVINKGSLYLINLLRRQLPDPVDGVGNAKRLGNLNDWIDTSCMVIIQ